MKHLKAYENEYEDPYEPTNLKSDNNFKPGDYVKCINAPYNNISTKNSVSNQLKINSVYVVDREIGNRITLKDVSSVIGYFSNRFILATQEEIEQYKLEQETNKYNL